VRGGGAPGKITAQKHGLPTPPGNTQTEERVPPLGGWGKEKKKKETQKTNKCDKRRRDKGNVRGITVDKNANMELITQGAVVIIQPLLKVPSIKPLGGVGWGGGTEFPCRVY